MNFIELVEANQNKRPSNQIGGLFGDGEAPASEAKREMGLLRYQAGIVLERLEKMVREQVMSGDVEGEEGSEIDNLRACLPQLLIQFFPKPNYVQPNAGIDDNYRNEALLAIGNYRHSVDACTKELLQIMINDASTAALQKAATKLWDIQGDYNKMARALEKLLEKEKEG